MGEDLKRFFEQSDDSPWFKKNDQDQQRSVEKKVQLGERGNQFLVHQAVNNGANHGSPDRPHSANDRHQENSDTDAKGENALGMDECSVPSVNASSGSGDDDPRWRAEHSDKSVARDRGFATATYLLYP